MNVIYHYQKIESYLTSLEAINDTQKGPRRERAKNLLEQYRRGPDYAHARDWKKEKKVKPVDGTSVHFHQVTDSSVIGINNGSFDVSRKPKSTGKRKSIRYHYTESSDEEDHSSDSDYTEKPERKQESRRSKRLRGKANCDDMDKGDIIVETSEDENTSHPTQPTMISNTSEDTTLCEITPSTPQQLNTSEGFATSRESTPCPTVHSATSTLIATPNKPIITKSTYDEFSAHIICAFNTTKLWLSSVCVSSLAIALIAILRTQKTLKPIVSSYSKEWLHLPNDDISLVTEEDMDEIFMISYLLL
ncbi:unnamed protein product [Rhizophagus irregularis]|nr:unnamed protein product [Rhizophagus irregularis]